MIKRTFIILSILFLSSCSTSPKKIEEKVIIPTVKIFELKEKGLIVNRTYTAEIKPEIAVDIKSLGNGTVQQIFAKIGQKLRKDQKLVTLDRSNDNTTKVNFDNIQNSLNYARSNYNSANSLHLESIRSGELRIIELKSAINDAEINYKNIKIIVAQNISQAKLAVKNAIVQTELNVNLAKTDLKTSREQLNNFLLTSEISIKDSSQLIEKNIDLYLTLLKDYLDNINKIIGVDDPGKNRNDIFKNYLGARKAQSFLDAKQSYRLAKSALNNVSNTLSTEEKILALIEAAESSKKMIDNTDILLDNTITANDFSVEDLEILKSEINNFQNGPQNINQVIIEANSNKQKLDNLKRENQNQIELLKLNITKAKQAIEAAEQSTNNSESSIIKSAREQLTLTEANAQSQLDSTESQIRSLNNQLDNSASNLRSIKLQRDNQLLSLKEQIIQLEGQLKLAEISLQNQTIKSPINGTLIKKYIEEGDEVLAGQTIAQIGELNKLKVIFEIPKNDLKFFRTKQKIKISDNTDGIIETISPIADPVSKKFLIEAIVINRNNFLNPGTFIDLNMQFRDKTNSFFIPLNAVQLQQNNNFVYIVTNNKSQKVSVTIGEVIEDKIEIITGVKINQKIVSEGFSFISDGQEVSYE